MGLGINTISVLEIRNEGLRWNNFYKPISLDDDFHMGYVFLMLIIDSIIYMLIAWLVCCTYIYVHVHVDLSCVCHIFMHLPSHKVEILCLVLCYFVHMFVQFGPTRLSTINVTQLGVNPG